jgi:hypothetical protein
MIAGGSQKDAKRELKLRDCSDKRRPPGLGKEATFLASVVSPMPLEFAQALFMASGNEKGVVSSQ